MELIKGKIKGTRSLVSFKSLAEMFDYALEHVNKHRSAEFKTTLENYRKAEKTEIDEERFTKEYVWACYVSGWSARVVTSLFDKLLAAHKIVDSSGNFVPASPSSVCDDIEEVLNVFANERKATAVMTVRSMISIGSWKQFSETYLKKPVDPEVLSDLPFMGPAMSCHLARNLGNLDLIKPDIHLTRLAEFYNEDSPLEMCTKIAKKRNMQLGQVDLILWMAATDAGTK